MSSSISSKQHNFQSLELENQTTYSLIKVKTIKVSDSTSDDDDKLWCFSTCRANYNEESFLVAFSAKDSWNVKKIVISYNGKAIKEQNFAGDGAESSGLFNNIKFKLSIRAMNIQFYSDCRKNFTFDLTYKRHADDEIYKTTFSMDLPRFCLQNEMIFKEYLGFYHPNKNITSFFTNNFEATETSSEADKELNLNFTGFRRMKNLLSRFETFGYCQMFENMLHIEDLTIRKALDDLTMIDKLVASTYQPNHFAVYFEGKKLSEKLDFNHLVLTPMEFYEPNIDLGLVERHRIYCMISCVDGSRVVFEKPRSKFISRSIRYHVQLVENRVPTRLACQALEKIRHFKLEHFFTSFDKAKLPKQPFKNLEVSFESITAINPSIGSNESQMKAVKSIVNRTSFPSPYIIFGPPGTGKTSTLVEAVAQIIKLQPKAKILVSANSNAACDEIGERLLKFAPRYKMYRLYSPSFDHRFPDRNKRLHPLLKPLSNIKYDINKYPSYQEFYSYNIVISTLVNCGRLVTANIKSEHFDYILIDECASTIEPLSLIPIASLGIFGGTINAQVVLAGDHKQLQGIVHSYFNEKHGFGISMMERVMTLDKYQYPYDPNYVTQLTDNFRSHAAILKFSNYHFYHSVLRAMQTKEVADFAIDWDFLPNKSFPLIFHSILAPSELEGTSLFNNEEAHVVASYVNKLLKDGICGKKVQASDIGIICPYSAQRKKLQLRLRYVDDLEVGTVEAFQGREKLIIIMSTVRSQTETVGFLKNEKRLNVALTRAKALLIVIGNGETLQKNKLWYKFVNYCYQNNAVVGERFMLRYRQAGTATTSVKKAHPIFHLPKVEVIKQDSNGGEESDNETIYEDGNWSSDDCEDYETGSDVSWTFEDFRMKAKTSKLSINAHHKNEEPKEEALSGELNNNL